MISKRDKLSKDTMQIILITLLKIAIGLSLGIDPLVWMEVP